MTRDDFPPLTRWQRVRRWCKALLFRDWFASRVVVILMTEVRCDDPEWDGAPRRLNRGEVARYAYEQADCLLNESVRPSLETKLRRARKKRPIRGADVISPGCVMPDLDKE